MPHGLSFIGREIHLSLHENEIDNVQLSADWLEASGQSRVGRFVYNARLWDARVAGAELMNNWNAKRAHAACTCAAMRYTLGGLKCFVAGSSGFSYSRFCNA